MALPKFRVKIFSDNVCPWCFVGKRNLETAMKRLAEARPASSTPSFDITWKPYFLNVDSPQTSEEPIKEYLEKKYGRGAGSRMASALEAAGEATGIKFNIERRVHNTLLSHRLVYRAHEQGKGNDMIEHLFRGYFEEGRNISEVNVLLELASKAGVDCSKKFLEGHENKEEVLREYREGRQAMNITGVPYFVISTQGQGNKTIALSGAQPPEAFVEAFETLL